MCEVSTWSGECEVAVQAEDWFSLSWRIRRGVG